MTRAKYTLAAVALLAAVASGTAFAQSDAAGRFIAVTGEVKIVGADGVARDAERGGEFRQGESIVTGTNALAQVRMTDGGALSVRAESQLKLEGYRFQGNDDPEPSFFASLIKGGFRTITGLIGRNRRDSYRVATTSATMGIRGTHFEIVHVVQPLPDAAPGTYNRVYDGTVSIRNRAGAELLVTRDQTVFVALPGNVAPVLVRPPAGIYSKPTPVPVFKPQARDAGDAAAHKDKAAPGAGEALRLAPRTVQPVESAPSLSPIEAPRTTISPTLTSPLLTPIDSPTTTTISPTLISPTTTTISPTTTTISPTTTTISPTTTTISPTTTTISPTTTTISPTTTTISPTLTSPTTTTISPTTTTISPTTTTISPTTTTISPTTTTISPTTTTISPTLTAPTTTTIRK